MTVYDYSVKDMYGNDFSLEAFRGKVVLIVNTATGCGFTPHYEPIEKMYEDYHDKGFEVLDIPCNQFMHQAPGDEQAITDFCTLHYNTKFPQMKKSDVNGENELPLYAWLKSQKGFSGWEGKGAKMLKLASAANGKSRKPDDIKWNFTKFVIGRDGSVVARFEPFHDMAEVEKCVAACVDNNVTAVQP